MRSISLLILALSAMFALCACSSKDSGSKTVSTGPIDGKALYIRTCQSCHGPTGKGNGPRSGMLRGKVPDFTDAAWQTSRSDAQIKTQIMEGKGGMPAFKYRYNDNEVEALIKVVRTFASAATSPEGTP